jgi:outer membrane protein insertion porin family
LRSSVFLSLKVLSVCLFILLSAILFCAQDSYSQLLSEFDVANVVIEGNKRIDSAAIKSQLKGAFGRVSREIVSDDVKTLYNTGFFDQVSVSLLPSKDKSSGNTLKYSLIEKPTVRKIFIKGNKEIKEDDLTEALKLGSSRFLDKAKIEQLKKNVSVYYQSKGFFDVAFEHSVVPVGENQVDLTFTVTEGQRYKIRNVEIVGVKDLDEDEMREAMQTKEYKWWSSWLFSTGRLSNEVLENDKGLLRQFFLDHGYIDGQVGDAEVVKKDGAIDIKIYVTEGPQYRIGNITASGDLIDSDIQKTIDGIKASKGKVFNATEVREDTFKISEKFTDIGFAYANVVPNTAVSRNEKLVNLEFVVSKGNTVDINRINIRGNTKTYDNVIRRTLKMSEQEKYSSSKIKRSQQLLERLGYFEEVNINSAPTEDPNKVNLDVNVREGSTGTFTAGAGYSSSDGAIFSMRVSENNILGTGRSVNLTGELGTERDNIILGFNDPRLNDSNMALGGQVLRTDREFSDFDRRLTGGNVTLGYPLEEVFGDFWEDIAASLKYEYLDIDIRDVDHNKAAPLVIASEGRSTASTFTPSLVRNTINNPLNPVRGSKQILSFEYAGAGGNEEYYLLEARNVWYYPMIESEFGDFVLSLRTTFGYGDSFNDDPFPLFRRYFPGGINTVRGFKERTLGPKDEKGNEFGGSKEFINNAEIIFPLINSSGIKGVVFYDIGQAFNDDESIVFGDLRRAYGFGLRWFSPLGPIRIEFGFPVSRQPGERSTVTMFSFGAPL